MISEFKKNYSPFRTVDSFNPRNEVEGFICRESTEYYGALLITKVNSREVPEQLIMGTPKIHYPFTSNFSGERKYRFPSAKNIEIYEKLDGTNILAFVYTDGKNRFLSFKTRLMPFINPKSTKGSFFQMWNEVASDYFDDMRRMITINKLNLSFELYGAKNPHLVLYDIPIAFALLFGVKSTGRIFSPSQIDNTFPQTKLMKIIDSDYIQNYRSIQTELNDNLKQKGDNYIGIEGTVWYLHTHDGKCVQYKCKPDIIEAIHMAASKGLNKNVILATCWNALENIDVLTHDFVEKLLLEEFKPDEIYRSQQRIENCINIVNDEINFREKVLEEYKKLETDIAVKKIEVMRALSNKFPREKMGKVYKTIIDFS